MTTITDTQLDWLVELDERESNGIRVTLVWNRRTNTLAVLVWDERREQSLTLAIGTDDDAYDVFNHPFAHAAFRGLDVAMTHELEAKEMVPPCLSASLTGPSTPEGWS